MSKYRIPDRNRPYLNVLDFLVRERNFLIIVLIGTILAQIATGYGRAAMWLGFLFAAYAAVANDSIQSLGTFIESNKKKKWWTLWLYVGVIFLVTVTFSWIYFDGDVTFQRLLKPNGETDYDSGGITSVVFKSMSGYAMAFILSFIVWYFSYNIIKKYFKSRKHHPIWTIIQWTVSGSLWAVWVMQDGANIAVFLPRQQSLTEFIIFASTIFLGLGFLFYLRGDKIQKVVSEKVRISDVRAATLIDFTYVLLLIYKLFISTVPLSTTWVFLGIIGGREIAVSIARNKRGNSHKVKSLRMIGKDVGSAFAGLIISVGLAMGANPGIREEVYQSIMNLF